MSSLVLSSLPDEVLKLILQHVPLQDRLGSCSLVCKRLRGAAAAATQQVHVGEWDSANGIPLQRAQSVLAWLERHGQHVTSLRLVRFPQPPDAHLQIRQLCSCPNLLDLEMWGGGHIQLGPTDDGHPGVIQGCPKLTRLMLAGTIVDAPQGGPVDSLSQLLHLQHLNIQPSYRECVVPAAALSRLTCLTHLFVGGFSHEHLRRLAALPHLQDLSLCANDTVGPSAVPGFVLPATLTKLRLRSRVEAGLLSLVPAGLQDLFLESGVEGPSTGPGSWLACVARLQHLTRLTLSSFQLVWPPPGPAYSALTASSSLAALKIYEHNLPDGIWPSVFPASRTLLHLASFEQSRDTLEEADPVAAFNAADLSHLVACCPSISAIDSINLQHGRHASQLHKLTALTRLVVRYGAAPWDDCVESMSGLAAVSRLRDLSVYFNQQGSTAAMLLPLVSLTALTTLGCTCWGDGGELDDFCYLENEDGSSPVWVQLLELCAAEPGCHPAALHSLAQRVAEQSVLSTQQQRQLAEQQAQISAQQLLVAQQGEQIADLRAQLQQVLSLLQPRQDNPRD